MTHNAENVKAAKPKAAGAVWSAPAGTAVPTDATTALAATFKSLGYVSADGIVQTIESDSATVTAFGGDEVMNANTSRKESFKFKPIETNQFVLAEQYGDDNVTVGEGGGLTVLHNGKDRGLKVYVFEILMSGDSVKRIVVPRGKITAVGDVTYKDGEPIGCELTLSALPDADGNTATEYIAEVVG